MRETQRLRTKIESATDLLSVVRTMKAMASVHINQLESAVRSLRSYMETIELGFQVALHNDPDLLDSKTAGRAPVGAVVFGSDQGMCGSFNERIAEHTEQFLADRGYGRSETSFILAGHRVGPPLERPGRSVRARLELPTSIDGITPFVRRLMRELAAWREEDAIERLLLFYNRQREHVGFAPHTEELLPIDRPFLERVAKREWEARTEPLVSIDVDTFFRTLVEEYIHVGLFRACAESLASENAARLASMQSAQRNISDRLEELGTRYRRTRQSAITSELLDIVGGYEALRRD